MTNRGFVLLAVLWVTVALGGLVAGAAGHATNGQETVHERIALTRGRWASEGCLAAAHAVLDEALRRDGVLEPPRPDTIAFAGNARCTVETRDPYARLHDEDGDGRLNLNAASAEELATLPGFGPEAVWAVVDARRWGRSLNNIGDVMQRLSPAAREEMASRLSGLLPLVAFRSDRLVLRARGWVSGERPVAVVEEVVVPAGPRVATIQRRVW